MGEARSALELMADTWPVVVLVGLAHGPRRCSTLLERAGGISEKMLTQTLRRLTDLGVPLLGPLTALTACPRSTRPSSA